MPGLAQDTEIKSVRFRVEPVTTPALSVVVENLRDSTLIAWRIEIGRGGSSGSNFIGSLPFPYSPGYGPVAPHQTRTMPFHVSATAEPVDARITAAIFADGYCEGSPEVLAGFFDTVKARTAELTYWIDALNKVPAGSSKEVSNYLLAKVAERAGMSPSDPLQIGYRLSSSLQGPRPEWWAGRMADNHRRDAQTALGTTNIRFLAAPAGAAPSVAVRTESAASTDYIVYIENLRETPIEGWTLQTARSPDGRPRMDHMTDACVGDPSLERPDQLGGRIQPHAVRAERMVASSTPDVSQIRLTMVLFDDLSFEGSAADRDAMLKSRERQAEDAAYWVEAFRGASALPAGEVKPYLQKKRAERSAQIAAAARGGSLHEVDEAIAALDRSPQMFPTWLSGRLTILEGQHARLTRHLTR